MCISDLDKLTYPCPKIVLINYLNDINIYLTLNSVLKIILQKMSVPKDNQRNKSVDCGKVDLFKSNLGALTAHRGAHYSVLRQSVNAL